MILNRDSVHGVFSNNLIKMLLNNTLTGKDVLFLARALTCKLVLEKNKYNKTKTARELDISRTTLNEILKY